PLFDLRGADQPAGAAAHRFAGRAQRRAATDGTVLGVDVLLRALRPFLRNNGDDLRNDVAGALQDDGVADAHVLAFDLVLVVQRGVAHQHAADIHRLQACDRRERAGAADLDVDPFQHGYRLLG